MEIKGAVVLITGASSGIGESTARAASRAGARVILLARREDRIRKLATALGDALAIRCDVTEQSQITDAVGAAADKFGRIDVLINNAGQGLQAPIEEIKIEDYRELLNLNLVAPLMMMQAVVPLMRKQGAGSIVNVSSGITFAPIPHTGAYNSSKAALNMLSNIARGELAQAGIAVSTMYPSITATDFVDSLRAGVESAKALEANSGLQRNTPEQVAEKILYLVKTGDERADLVPVHFGGTYTG
jgi:NAD(P)-dependent dehydrogenase (short-subunit alcohol dehydrogenase family)